MSGPCIHRGAANGAKVMRIVVLDSLRGIFALMVAALHGLIASNIFWFDLVRNADVFVDFFFVLSGFVITLSYGDRVHDARGASGFLIRRIGRLWPLHMAMLLALLGLVCLKAMAGLAGIYEVRMPYTAAELGSFALEHLFLVQSFRQETLFWLNFPSWSISAELWAYVVFALVCLAPRARLTLVIGLTVFGALAAHDLIEPGFGGFFKNGLHRAIGYFFLGYLTCRVWQQIEGWRLPLPHLAEIGLVAVVTLLVLNARTPAADALLPLAFAATILVFSWQAGLVSRLLMAAPLQALGRWSYSIYMVHVLVYTLFGMGLRFVERVTGLTLYSSDPRNPDGERMVDLGAPWINDLVHLGILAMVIALAALTYRYIELPGQTWSRGLARRVEQGGSVPTGAKP